MEERILVYKDREYKNVINRYLWMQRSLQDLVNGLIELGIEPTERIVKSLLDGNDLRQLVAEKNVSESFGSLPKQMQKTMKEMFAKENDEAYMNCVGIKAANIKQVKDRGQYVINYDLFSVENGKVILSPEYITETEKWYCVFVDTPGKKLVYDKWLEVQEVIKQFETVIKNVEKTPVTNNQKAAGIYTQDLRGIAIYASNSIVKASDDGSLVLDGYNFKFIQ